MKSSLVDDHSNPTNNVWQRARLLGLFQVGAILVLVAGCDPGEADRLTEPNRWVDLHGNALYSSDFLRTGYTQLSQNLVQETFLAAVKLERSVFRGSKVGSNAAIRHPSPPV